MTTNNAAELGRAIERNENSITVDGDLAKKTFKIKAVGQVAWVIAGGTIAVAIVAILAMPAAPAAGPYGLIAESVALGAGGAAAASVLGVSATVAAISMGVGAKSKNVVKKLRDNYNIQKISDSKVILTRKK